MQKYKTLIDETIKRPNTQIRLIVAYSGLQDLAQEPLRDITDFLNEINDPTELIKFDILKQDTIHTSIAEGSVSNPINSEIILENWGLVSEPFTTYYGVVNGSYILDLYKKYNPRLFSPNIRSFLGSSHINKEIINTIHEQPDSFFYFNNGITFICDSIEKKLSSGTNRNHGIFNCTNIFIINGAQTAGSIFTASNDVPENIEKLNILVKIISLEKMPNHFGTIITKATNTQNIIDSRDFISQDPEQEQLKIESAIDNIYYSYKRGDIVQDKTKGFDFEEAAISLGICSSDPNLITRFKREVSILWSDISKDPYKKFFNSSLNAIVLWNKVRLVREIEEKLNQHSANLTGRDSIFCVHGNRLIEGLASYLILKNRTMNNAYIKIAEIKDNIEDCTKKAVDLIIKSTNELYPDAYLGYLFKNQAKCIEVWTHALKNMK